MMSVKKALTSFSVKTFFLFGGIEYAVILPTLWDYLHLNFGASKFFYGLTLSAFSMANLLSGPLFGLTFDYTRQTKLIVLFANLFEIGGNFMYFAARSKYMVLASRFVVGIGAGAGAALFGEVSRTTTRKERTAAFTIMIAVRQVGLVIGPGLNLFLRQLDSKVGPFVLDKYTSPGALMTVIWIILELIFLFFFFELPLVDDTVKSKYEQYVEYKRQQQQVQNSSGEVDEKCSNVNQNVEEQNSNCDPSLSVSEQEKSPLLRNDSMKDMQTPPTSHRSVTQPPLNFIQRAYWLLNEILRQELVYLLAATFVMLFNQTSIEAMVVPLLEELLGWSEFETSLFFCGGGIELIVSFVLLLILSKKISDRWLLLSGLCVELLGYVWLLVTVGGAEPGTPWIHVKLLLGAFIVLFGLPFIFVPNGSLLSKLLPRHVQGFGQGVRRSTGSIAAILGPLWAGASLHLYYLLLGVPLGILTGLMVLTFDSFSRLKVPTKSLSESESQ